VLHTLSFSQTTPFSSFSPPFLYFLPLKRSPSLFAYLPLFISTPLVLIFTTVLLPAKLSGIFSFTLSVSFLPLSWNSDFWGVFVLFRLSHMHSMWQRLVENPLINAEVKIFNLLACSRHLLETIRESSVQLASGKVGFLPFIQELFSRIAPLLLGTWDDHVSFFPYPIAPWAFLQVYTLGLVRPLRPNYFLGLRPG